MLTHNNFTGKFIVIYGSNNIGKTTQMRILAKRLIDNKNYLTYLKYPIYNLKPTGPIINEILRQSQLSFGLEKDKYSLQVSKILGHKLSALDVEKEIQKLYAQNRFDFQEHLHGMLKAGITVLAEDYTGTGIAWGMTRDIDLEYLEKINTKLLLPDLAILLDGERFTTGIEIGHRNEDIENQIMLKNRQIYQTLAAKYNWTTVNANGTVEEVHDRIWNTISEYFKET